jgi:hypothetical protein
MDSAEQIKLTRRNIAWIAVFLFLLAVTSLQVALCQKLRRRNAHSPLCSAVELRIVAKHNDGSPVTDLSPSQFEAWFIDGSADVVSLHSFSPAHDPAGITSILLVLPPFANTGTPSDIKGVVAVLAHHEEFRFQAAVLSPDGKLTPFSSDLGALRDGLQQAIRAKKTLPIDKWKSSELSAFLKLRRLPGRHVIVRAFDERNPHRFAIKDEVARDATLEVAASYDIATLYSLLTPVNDNLTIPGGDASAEHIDQMPDVLGINQSAQLQILSQEQGATFARRSDFNRYTPGKTEASLVELIQDVIDDGASTYDLVMQPHFACPDTSLRPFWISPNIRNLRIFSPSAIQMIPYVPASK